MTGEDRRLIEDFLAIQAIGAEARIESSGTRARRYLSKACSRSSTAGGRAGRSWRAGRRSTRPHPGRSVRRPGGAGDTRLPRERGQEGGRRGVGFWLCQMNAREFEAERCRMEIWKNERWCWGGEVKG